MGDQISFQDIFKKSFLELSNVMDVNILNMVIGLSITLVVALFIYQVYKTTFNGVVYNHNFSTSLVLICLVTSMVIMTISSNVVLSLGMVGALSIVRFRAAIKDPKDIVFMFWSIAGGIAAGAGIYTLAVGGSLFIGLVMFLMSKNKYMVDSYLLIVKFEKNGKKPVFEILSKLDYQLKSKIVTNEITELTVELRNIGDNTSYVDDISDISEVNSAVLVKYNGDYTE